MWWGLPNAKQGSYFCGYCAVYGVGEHCWLCGGRELNTYRFIPDGTRALTMTELLAASDPEEVRS